MFRVGFFGWFRVFLVFKKSFPSSKTWGKTPSWARLGSGGL